MPLTADRAKPAVPFAGGYRLIDFAISNLINSGLRQVVVLTQYKSHSLDRHISQTWRLSRACWARTSHRCPPSSASASAGSAARPTRSCRASTSSTTRSPTSSSWSAPTTCTAWTSARCSQRTSSRARASRSPGSVSRSRWPTSSASSTSTRRTRTRIAAFLEKPQDADRPRRLPRRGAGLDGQLHLRHRRAHRGGGARRRAARLEPRHGRRHHPLLRRARRGRRVRHEAQRRAGLDRPRSRLLARRRDDRVVLRRAPGSHLGAADLQPLQPRVADLQAAAELAAREVRARRRERRSAMRSTRSSRSAPCCRAPTSSAASSARGRSSSPGATVADSVLFERVDVGANAACSARSSTRTSSSSRARRSASTATRIGPADSRSPRPASRWSARASAST